MRSHGKILDATLGLIGSGGFEAVSIASAAHAAGVTRQTVYSIFGSREELVSQAMAGHMTEVARGLQAGLAAARNPCEYVVELIVACRSSVRTDPVLITLLRSESSNPLFDSGAVGRAKAVARTLLAPLVELYPEVRPRFDDIVEISVHLGLSAVLFDDDALRSDDDLRAFLTRWLAPAMPPLP
ncbi:TetR/AcrR family transcriptional regulator [Rhodococcus spelaei]|uniref:TetR/AcrR family transcriptional regulator n=1 Tax=Rhodococcus spelaei TaxID=2546320 RepID=A0A541B1S4_9NOCA|nr:TetR/AcrR family transcriptional regulator [Rhodococcus spelaei]TQF66261.1 TetR/AcrR family transcriptional regulator [Rhodococcus spelaei]